MQERTFNRRKRQFFRKRIALSEAIGGLLVLLVLASAVGWVAAQEDNFDPGERDIRFAVLQEQSVEDRLYKRPLLAWVEPGANGTSAGINPRLGVFPEQIVGDGWQVSTRLRQFDPDNLYVKINGAAEQYLRLGFRQLHFIGLKRTDGPEELSIELYDQGDFNGGMGIFSAQRDPAKALHRQGALHYYETSVGAIGVMGRWFFKVAGNSESPALREKARQLVGALSGLPVAEGEVPFGFRVLVEGLGLPFADVAYEGKNVFQFDFAQDFWFGRIAQGEDGRYFLHRAKNAAAAEELYALLLTEQGFDYEIEADSEQRTLMRHRFLNNFFAMAQEGPFIFGVENLKRREDAAPALERLELALRQGS